MKLNIFFILFLLAGIFFATYGLVVGNPFEESKLDFQAYGRGLLDLTLDTSDFPAAKLLLTIVVFALAHVTIWLIKRVLEV